jgi:prophage regulatory protein
MTRPLKATLSTAETHRALGNRSDSTAPGALNSPKALEGARLQRLPAKFLRFATVRERTGLSRSTIWRLERRGDFPKHRRISANAVAWVEEEVAQWMQSKMEEIAV